MSLEARDVAVFTAGLQSKPLLKHISFTAPDRTITIVIGKTGAGKSTLLRALAGLSVLSAGNVYYDDRPLWKGRRVDRALLLRNAVAFQFPEHQLFARTVQGEFDYSLGAYRLPKADRLRRTADALAGQRLPAAYLERSPFLLSGGQKRRVALATIMAAETPWLFLDEPSAGLDAASLSRLTEELLRWKERCGIVLATHDLDAFLPIADRVLVLHRGKIAADVTPVELMANPTLLRQYGIGLTGAMEVAAALKEAGFRLPSIALTPERLAEAIEGELRGMPRQSIAAHPQAKSVSDVPVPSEIPLPETLPGQSDRSFVYALDPKRKWLVYTLLSIGIVLQTGWAGLGIALLFVGGSVSALTPEDRGKLLRMCKPLLWLVTIAVAFSGIQLAGAEGLSFSFGNAADTFRRWFAFFEITVIGLVFTLSTSSAAMKSGLETMLKPFRRLHVPVEVLALTASLVLRFIPLIIEETDRFIMIAKARGKRAPKRGNIHVRDIPVFVIPLMISLFQAVEELIVAMEWKGYMQHRNLEAVQMRTLRQVDSPKERQLLWIGLIFFLLLVCVRIYEEVNL
ncbi:ATP-binding cassette domain-containing protein [Paenibacillus thermotolerans]|uniref:ATP-binding cassette domain-containing protein n=1 Tax=Paenibacillus thermotolerans TaxID=3027807 RepID=UPI002368B347|nr:MULTISPECIES: ATP-binding cassette domain-containing protein [unclassified Paenibacillus]